MSGPRFVISTVPEAEGLGLGRIGECGESRVARQREGDGPRFRPLPATGDVVRRATADVKRKVTEG